MRKEKKKGRKGLDRRLVYGIVLVTVVLVALLVAYYLFQSRAENWTAAIVDQLTVVESLFNPTFNDTCTSLLTGSGYDVRYYPGSDVTVGFYEELPSKGERIIVVRAHSAVRDETDFVDLFTSEVYEDGKAYGAYYDLVIDRHISRAVFNYPPYERYFAVGPTFVSSVMKGRFVDGLVVLMGCDSLNQTSMAEALIDRGARVVVGWTGNVTVSDTDSRTLALLDLLLAESYTVQGAVQKVNLDFPISDTRLAFYPAGAGSYVVPEGKSSTSSVLSEVVSPLFVSTSVAGWRRVEFSLPSGYEGAYLFV
jgi:hypothetical protein